MSARARGAMAERVAVLSPNWLGDAVMALPAIADIRRTWPHAHLAVAARPSVAALFRYVPGVDAAVVLPDGSAGAARAIADGRFDTAVLFPNSFRAAWLTWRAGVRERWGYRGDLRGVLLTRAVARPEGCHQSEYYQRLTAALGFASGAREPRVDVPPALRSAAVEVLATHGYDGRSPIVALAPGAAYGTAKQWMPSQAAALVSLTTADGSQCVLVGSRGDVATGQEMLAGLPPPVRARVVNVIGETTLDALAGVLAVADVCVGNDSGATHLAAAIGTPVVAIFGPTSERQSSPTPRAEGRAIVLTHQVWCRPCMLRECPIDHSCMRGITAERVYEHVRSQM